MPVQHVNRRGDTYYLHVGEGRSGKPNYWFSRKADGTLLDAVPEGFEVYEDPDARVVLRRKLVSLVTGEEAEFVRAWLRAHVPDQHVLVDVRKKTIEVYHAEVDQLLERAVAGESASWLAKVHRCLSQPAYLNYHATFRFELQDREERRFSLHRWCYRGFVNGWLYLAEGNLENLVALYCPHLGRDSYFELWQGQCVEDWK